MTRFETLDTLPALTGKPAGTRVLLRGDLNVPMVDGMVSEATRIKRLAPTIVELTSRGCKVVVMSHFGRPNGKVTSSMSLQQLLKPLSEAIGGRQILFVEDCIGDSAARSVRALPEGGVALLENLRFHAGEEANDKTFVQGLAALGDVFVNDAFSTAHRAHASTEGLARVLPSAVGRSMQSELEALETALGNPARPVVALVGGSKVSTKLKVLSNLVSKVDRLVIGGAMANTFLYALGTNIGASLCEKDLAETVWDIMANSNKTGCKVLLPLDAVVSKKLEVGAISETVPIEDVRKDTMILDIGIKTAETLATSLLDCKTVLWNGPLGAFETKPFDEGTNFVARAVATLTVEGRLCSVAGGGDTVAALAAANALNNFSYVSTAGGAFLEWLEGKELPGVASLCR